MSEQGSEFMNRRRHRRIEADLGVRISTIEPERDPWTGRPFFRATRETCANVSRGGAFVKTTEPLDPGRRLLGEVHLPDEKSVEAIGRVAWSKRIMKARTRENESGIGIEFIGGSSDHFDALERYIDAAGDAQRASRD